VLARPQAVVRLGDEAARLLEVLEDVDRED